MLKFCERAQPEGRELDDLSYVDELRSIQIGKHVDSAQILETRYSYDEDLILEALNVGKEDYWS